MRWPTAALTTASWPIKKAAVALLKEVEPTLSDAQHAQVTKLLCELTAYNVMQTLNSLQTARPKTTFRG